MAIKSILTSQEDFTGEFPVTSRTSALWRFNEKTPDENLHLMDSSGHSRHFTISGWSGTSANLIAGRFGRYFRQNIVNPPTTIFSPRLLKKLPSFSAIRWVFSEVGLTIFCLKYLPNLPAIRFADVPDQPEKIGRASCRERV